MATVLLAGGLDQVRLQPGTSFSLADQSEAARPEIPLPGDGGGAVLLAVRGVLALVLVALPFYIIYHLWTPEGRRKLLSEIIALAIVVGILSFLPHPQGRSTFQSLNGNAVPNAALPSSGPTATFSIHPPEWATALTVLGLAILIAVGATWLVRIWARRKKIWAETPLEQIADRAGQALVALRTGDDLRNIVLSCYAEMSRVVREQRDLSRAPFLTPLEFEEKLVAAGLPPEPVRGLTRLFEAVRYGARTPDQEEEVLAVQCLTEIVVATRKRTA